jgi:hypothetical protein
VRRLLPVALLPFSRGLSRPAWVFFGSTCIFFAYVEGYRGFQLRFSPFVVRRAFLLQGPHPLLHRCLAPAYAMGFFHATPKRRRSSWILFLAVIAAVVLVKRLPYPYRSILDAGVCMGLSWGMCSVAVLYLRALLVGSAPDVDPCLPDMVDP